MTSAGAPDLSPQAILGDALTLARRHPHVLLVPFVVLGMVTGLLGSEMGFVLERTINYSTSQGLLEALFDGLDALLDAIFLVTIAVGVLLSLVVARATFMPLRGEGAPALGPAYRAVTRVYLRGLTAFVPAGFAITIGFFALFLPGVFILGALLTLPAVVVAEGHAFLGAIGRALELSRGHRGEAFFIALVLAGVAAVPTLFFGWVPVLGSIVSGAAQGTALALASVASTLFYARRIGIADALPGTATSVTVPAATTTPPSPEEPLVPTHRS